MKTTYMNLIILNLFPSVLMTGTFGNHFLKILKILVSLSGDIMPVKKRLSHHRAGIKGKNNTSLGCLVLQFCHC